MFVVLLNVRKFANKGPISIHISSIVRDILIRCIFDFADRFNTEIHKMLVSNKYCLNCRIIKKIFTNNVLINLSFCYKIILTLGPKQHLLLPINPLQLAKTGICLNMFSTAPKNTILLN